MEDKYIALNRLSWNNRLQSHLESDFYDLKGFLEGKTSLNDLELNLLGQVVNKSILHLQCHFGQDTVSLGRLGAKVVGVDLADKAIDYAKGMVSKKELNIKFICCNIYDLPQHLDEQFDIVFTSYGTIGWLPDLNRWSKIITHFLKPQGKFVMVEFHPLVWMFDDNFDKIAYHYFNKEVYLETHKGTYADRDANIILETATWNHSLSEVLNNLLKNGLSLQSFEEYDYSPYNCFNNTVEIESKKYRIKHLADKIPMLYSVVAKKI